MERDYERFAQALLECHELLEEQKHRDMPRREELEEMSFAVLSMANAMNPYVTGRVESAESARVFLLRFLEAKERRIQRYL